MSGVAADVGDTFLSSISSMSSTPSNPSIPSPAPSYLSSSIPVASTQTLNRAPPQNSNKLNPQDSQYSSKVHLTSSLAKKLPCNDYVDCIPAERGSVNGVGSVSANAIGDDFSVSLVTRCEENNFGGVCGGGGLLTVGCNKKFKNEINDLNRKPFTENVGARTRGESYSSTTRENAFDDVHFTLTRNDFHAAGFEGICDEVFSMAMDLKSMSVDATEFALLVSIILLSGG